MESAMPPSPNWFCSGAVSAGPAGGVVGFAARSAVVLVEAGSQGPVVRDLLEGHTERVTGVAFSPHVAHTCASCSDDRTVRVWDTRGGTRCTHVLQGAHAAGVTCVQFSPHERDLLVSADERGAVCCWRLPTAAPSPPVGDAGDPVSKGVTGVEEEAAAEEVAPPVTVGDARTHMPAPRHVTCLALSPHHAHLLALGYKDGLILVVDLRRRLEPLLRLRGHEDEVHALGWCPDSAYDPSGTPKDHPTPGTGDDLTAATIAGSLWGALASGSKDRTVRVWSLARAKCSLTLRLPPPKRRGGEMDTAAPRERLWVTVCWSHSRPLHLISSAYGGELLLWDVGAGVRSGGRIKGTPLGAGSDSPGHSRVVFNIVAFTARRDGSVAPNEEEDEGEEDEEFFISSSMDRDVCCWRARDLTLCWRLPTLGGFAYCLAFPPVESGSDPGALAVGGGDGVLRVWRTLSPRAAYDVSSYWQGVHAKLTALAWHPSREGRLAFGTDEGKVGIYDLYNNKPPQISSSYHKKTVYSLSWGPPVPPSPEGQASGYALYSCGGEGSVLQHNPRKLSDDAVDINTLIHAANLTQHKFPARSELSWRCDGSLLALGNDDGSMEIYSSPLLHHVCTLNSHHKTVNCLRWLPPYHNQSHVPSAAVGQSEAVVSNGQTAVGMVEVAGSQSGALTGEMGPSPNQPGRLEPSNQSALGLLLASGSNNAPIFVHDLQGVQDGGAVHTRTLAGHTARVTALDWSPHRRGLLVSASYDGTVQVWRADTGEPLSNYRGHGGRVLSVAWCPSDADVVWSGGDDSSVHKWRPSQQPQKQPPRGKKSVELERKRLSQSKGKAKKSKKAADEPTQNATRPVEASSWRSRDQASARDSPPIGQPRTEVATTGEIPNAAQNKARTMAVAAPGAASELGEERVTQLQVAQPHAAQDTDRPEKRKLELDARRRRKARSLFPLSVSRDHRPREDLQNDCLLLAARLHDPVGQGAPQSVSQHDDEQLHLGLYLGREEATRWLEEEERQQLSTGHAESAFQLLLWRGEVATALLNAARTGEMTESLLALAPMAGIRVWTACIESYVQQLLRAEQPVRAATFLLALHRTGDALALLRTHGLYREAVALAKLRLPPSDPMLGELYQEWAVVLEASGHYAAAAKCQLAAGRARDAITALSRRADLSALSAALAVAERARLPHEDTAPLALRLARALAGDTQWERALSTVKPYPSLLGRALVCCVQRRVSERLRDPVTSALAPALLRDWQTQLGVAASLPGSEGSEDQQARLEEAERQISALLGGPTATPHTAQDEVVEEACVRVTAALLACLRGDGPRFSERSISALVHALGSSQHAIVLTTCTALLLPTDVRPVAGSDGDVVCSLAAYHSYYRLYQAWWKHGGAVQADTAALHPDTKALHASTAEVQADAAAVHPGTPALQTDTAAVQADTAAPHSDTTTLQGDTEELQEDAATLHADTQALQADAAEVQVDTEKLQPGTEGVMSSAVTDTMPVTPDTTATGDTTTAIIATSIPGLSTAESAGVASVAIAETATIDAATTTTTTTTTIDTAGTTHPTATPETTMMATSTATANLPTAAAAAAATEAASTEAAAVDDDSTSAAVTANLMETTTKSTAAPVTTTPTGSAAVLVCEEEEEDEQEEECDYEREEGGLLRLAARAARACVNEQRAAVQDAQRRLVEVKEAVAKLISAHTRGELESGPGLHDLTAEAARITAAFPTAAPGVKAAPFPDVCECCLLLVSMDHNLGVKLPTRSVATVVRILDRYGQQPPYASAWNRLRPGFQRFTLEQ
ncbi:gem-associated protein 5 isoform X2 [Lampetra fluviatilis]